MTMFLLKRYMMRGVKAWQPLQKMSGLAARPATVSRCSLFISSSVPRACSSLIFYRQNASLLQRIQPLHFSVARLQQKRRKTEEPPPRELDLVRYDMKELKKAPKPALYLSFSGLVPFISAPLIMAITELYVPEIAYAQVAYGASLLSFLGGARWGFALPEGSPAKPDWMNLANSMVPCLLAWAALLFRDSITEAGIMVIMGLGIALHYDLALLPTYPSWFKALRTIFTVVAAFSLAATLFLKAVYPEERLTSDK